MKKIPEEREKKVVVVLTKREKVMLRRLAKQNGLDPAQYAGNIVSGFLKSQIMGRFKRKFDEMPEDRLAKMFGEIQEE